LEAVDTFYGLNDNPVNEKSWLYSYTSFVAAHNLTSIFASQRHTWIAAYQNTPPAVGHTLWQSTDGKTGANITNWPGCGRCDTSLYNGNLAQLAALGWHHATVDPPPVTFPAPTRLVTGKAHVSLAVSWAPVTLAGKPPASYTIVAVGLDGKEYARDTTTTTQYILQNLNSGWTYKVRVWANGGPSAPPHAEITIKL